MKTLEMIEQVINRRNMHLAYKRVLANKGSAGIDSMQVKELRGFIQKNGAAIALRMVKGCYLSQPILGVSIPKSPAMGGRKTVCLEFQR
jgi:retron-type reverse transcriptase